jgi:glycosyltransferase involved in cell wall biosynthesis
MRILITNTEPKDTGSFTVAKAVTKELLKLGHQVRLFYPDSSLPEDTIEPEVQKCCYVWKFPFNENGFVYNSFPLMIPDPHFRSISSQTFKDLSDNELNFYFNKCDELLSYQITDFKPDIIECQHIWIFDHIVSKKNLPFIATAHHSDQMGFLYDLRMQKITKESVKKSAYIFAISDFVKNEVHELYGIEQSKIFVLTNGYDHSIFYPKKLDRKKILDEFDLKIPENAKIFSFVGKLSKTKGIDYLLKATNYLKNQNIHFILLGSGSIDQILHHLPKNSYNLKNIHILGHQSPENVDKIHNIADFGILPSRSEGFGIACLEAMACGIPMLVTNIGGVKEYAIGKITKVSDPKILANSILELVNISDEDYKCLSKKAIKAANKFSWHVAVKKRIEFYKKALKLKK